MTDPDMMLFAARRAAARDTTPDSIEDAVRKHIDGEAEPLPPTPDDPSLAPTDDEVFDGVPAGPITDVPTQPMRLPNDTIPNPFDEDDDWEDQETGVHAAPTGIHDPTFCMM